MNITRSEAAHAKTRMITARFESRAVAEKAKADVVAAGLSGEAAKITDGAGTVTGDMASGARRGFVLTAHVPDERYDAVRAILGRDGQIADV